jgi:predicted  nucleic acid-binding Zn-ribbon protein
MSHQCVHCGKIYPAGSKDLLEGCRECGSHFFFFINDEQLARIREKQLQEPIILENRKEVEREIRELAGITELDTPVILDIESVRVSGDGKFEIDLVNVFNKKRPLIYKVEEGKYIIDLSTTLKNGVKDLKEIRNPDD